VLELSFFVNKDAHAVILAYSMVDRSSFDVIKSWKHKVDAVCPEAIVVLLQNKIDLIDHAAVSRLSLLKLLLFCK